MNGFQEKVCPPLSPLLRLTVETTKTHWRHKIREAEGHSQEEALLQMIGTWANRAESLRSFCGGSQHRGQKPRAASSGMVRGLRSASSALPSAFHSYCPPPTLTILTGLPAYDDAASMLYSAHHISQEDYKCPVNCLLLSVASVQLLYHKVLIDGALLRLLSFRQVVQSLQRTSLLE
ncbi:unnamed protein product [Pleuronectes platessa]|uniref:Uncharacterized protein n=1 Tax=Pleuronectes platessa TaxID=8262 RepID=A0A9N7U9T6_PLEPL|nr:unnamed protein product [Pleuronectes platessa]